MKTSNFSISIILFLVIGLITFSACDSTTTVEGDDEVEPVGFIIKQNNNAVVTQNPQGELSGSITMDSQQSSEFSVVFLSEDGDEFIPEPSEHALSFTVPNGANFSISQEDGIEQTFIFTATAQSSGSSTFKLNLLHEGSAELVSQDISVTVN